MFLAPGMHPTLEELEAFDRGDVNNDEASAIEEHLVTCQACLARMDTGSSPDDLVSLIRATARHGLSSPPAVAGTIPTGYELLEPIGRGGMGVVFKARQRALGRMVALKQIRAGLDADAQELARFHAEALAAARLAHPNIVKVFDVGQQDGLPFIAMELVEGGRLPDRLANGPLPPHEAAVLVESLARAVEHAHQQGIVHRDLKPANILLAPDLTPRIVDFGLVKFQDTPSETKSGALLGTPRYMAPEQAAGDVATPAVDIHALGAILYECLTGRPPFQAATALEVIEQIRNQEPVVPGRLQPGVQRDLQTICMKCLEKDPRRRYATAGELADDLGRFLRSEPILARPVGPVARLGKWIARKPYRAALAGVAVLALIAAISGLAVHQSRLRAEIGRTAHAAEEARNQKSVADANYRGARAAIQAILDCYNDPAFVNLPRRNEVQRAQAEKALIFYDHLLKTTSSPDPVVQIDLARASREAATIQFEVGRFQDAVAGLERSVQLLDAVGAKRPNDREVIREQIQSRTKLGLFLWHTQKKPDRALAELRRAVSDAERLVESDPKSVDARSDLAWCLHDLGSVHLENQQLDLALAAHRRAIEINRKLIEELPDDARRRITLAENLSNLGLIIIKRDPDQAEAAYREAAGILEVVLRDRPDVRCVTSLASVLNNWANLAAKRGRNELALERLVHGLTLVDDVLKREPGHTELRYNALNLHGSRANLYASLGRHAEAVADWDRVIEYNDVPEDRLAYRLSRIMALVKTPDYARGLAEAEELARGQAGSKPLAGADLYNFACVFALASTAAKNDERLEPVEQTHRADSYAGSALVWLSRASNAGFFEDPMYCEHALRDADLASLRERDEFQKLVRSKSR